MIREWLIVARISAGDTVPSQGIHFCSPLKGNITQWLKVFQVPCHSLISNVAGPFSDIVNLTHA